MSKTISVEQMQRLYALADQIKRLSPWEWMNETDVFGVKNDLIEEIGFVSVMGGMGRHFAVTVYKGWGDLERFWLMQDIDDSMIPEFIFETSQLMLSFEDRAELNARDYATIRGLGLSYRGRANWPKFQAFRPGYFPWNMEDAWEADHLITCLEQALGVMMRFEDTPGLLSLGSPDSILVRARGGADENWEWKDVYMQSPEAERMLTYYEVEKAQLDKVDTLPRTENVVELDYFLSRHPIAPRGERPMCVYVLLVTDAESGYVMGSNVLDATGGLEGILGQIPAAALEIFERQGALPVQVKVSRPVLAQILGPLEERLDIDVDLTDALPMTHIARESLETFMAEARR